MVLLLRRINPKIISNFILIYDSWIFCFELKILNFHRIKRLRQRILEVGGWHSEIMVLQSPNSTVKIWNFTLSKLESDAIGCSNDYNGFKRLRLTNTQDAKISSWERSLIPSFHFLLPLLFYLDIFLPRLSEKNPLLILIQLQRQVFPFTFTICITNTQAL